LRRALVVTEVALSLVLLIGAGLMIQSFYRLQQVDPGFKPDNLLTLQMSLPNAKYPDSQARLSFYEQLLPRVSSLAGVSVAAVASGLPLGNNGNQTSYMVEGQPEPERGKTPLMEVVYASADYFRAMGITLLQGELFTGREDVNNRVMVIDETFAKKHWPDENPIGKQIRFGGTGADNPRVTVIGVVGRVKMEGLSTDSNRVQGYFPFNNNVWQGMTLVARTANDPTALAAAIKQEVLQIDKDQPVFNIRTMEEIRTSSVAPQRLYMMLLGIFAAVALVLAAVGIYGVMSYSVTQRTHEIGIRMALGASPRDVLRHVVGQGMALTLAGVGIGVVGAFILVKVISSLLSSMLFGVSATDPVTFISISILLAAVALAACALPARRATRVDPITALRYE
jgi:putative ABC transport system permease protein